MKTFGRIAYALFNFAAAGGMAIAGVKVFQVMQHSELVIGLPAAFASFFFGMRALAEGIEQLIKIGKP